MITTSEGLLIWRHPSRIIEVEEGETTTTKGEEGVSLTPLQQKRRIDRVK